jgi:hypothetical protein
MGIFPDVIIAVIVSFIMYAGLIWFAFSFDNGTHKPVLILCGISGAAFGWVIGILISPYNNEVKRFSELAKVGYGFLTGYVVSKLDPLINKIVGIDKTEINTIFMIIIAYFTASLVTSIVLTYISRIYWIGEYNKVKGK